MANPRRNNGLTRFQQWKRNTYLKIKNPNYNTTNSAFGEVAERASAIGNRGGLFRDKDGVFGSGMQAGYAKYGDQKQNANSRASYRNVRAAFGLSVS